MLLPEFLLLALATWWLTHMVINTEGPYDIFERLRIATRDAKWTKLTCIYCTATQVALLVMLSSLFFVSYENVIVFGLHWMAIAGSATLVAGLLGALEAI